MSDPQSSAPGTAAISEIDAELIPEIIAEFSQVFAFARTRWARFAEEVHPELRVPGMMILQTILRRGPITATGVSGLLDMDKAMVSRQVAKLRSLGLIDAEGAESDRRATLLTASPAAHSAVDELQARIAEDYRARFAEWSSEELATLQGLLHRFNAMAVVPESVTGQSRHQGAQSEA